MTPAPLLVVRNRLSKGIHLFFIITILFGVLALTMAPLFGVVLIGFFGYGYFKIFQKHKERPVALTVEQDGIHVDNPAVFLPWKEITGVGTWRFGTTEMVGFLLRDRESVFDEAVAGGVKRAILEANTAYGYDFFVNSSTMEPPARQVAEVIKSELTRRGKA